MDQVCVLCGSNAYADPHRPHNINGEQYYYDFVHCPNCGRFMINRDYRNIMNPTNTDDFTKLFYANRHILSGIAYHMSKSSKQYCDFTFEWNIESLNNFLKSLPFIPETDIERINHLLLYIYNQSNEIGTYTNVPVRPAIAFARSSKELLTMLEYLFKQDLIDIVDDSMFDGSLPNVDHQTHKRKIPEEGWMVRLTFKGIKEAEALRKKLVISKQAFVAMWFSEETLGVWEEAIEPAIFETGYNPIRIDKKEHNDEIVDQIIISIRESRFVVADLTGQRNGVYYEAGYALGLDVPVIFTCRKDELDKVHFDINHRNIILWESPEDLKDRLRDRIKATIT